MRSFQTASFFTPFSLYSVTAGCADEPDATLLVSHTFGVEETLPLKVQFKKFKKFKNDFENNPHFKKFKLNFNFGARDFEKVKFGGLGVTLKS